ncbi:iron response transcriptional regulator IrrA [Alkalilimnicola ehrlichii MLHE-1]|uniref:Ferric uptake regulation protein n=1 Tax=Alkalilimnicola ehrlichii (strain ATCC BAA-1101 / DSM 17681 / MLHE-1) TaxID=187272 RepID=Q0ABX2_ALKEH|nr:Fur family transcriptional regulator [Alkalilimnicola ehrlichii]ABI55665.1 ferric uptake regulator, Fur family [Alkalilimnicola ehrlichii MLHE-1]
MNDMHEHEHDDIVSRLRDAGLRPTRQRLALADLLFSHGDRHVTAESLYDEALGQGVRVSLATIYNTLNQFTSSGLLREVVVDSGKSYFDTNTEAHQHVFNEDTGAIDDVQLSLDAEELASRIAVPEGHEITGVDVVVRLRRSQ